MTVTSIRCYECDTVKRERYMEMDKQGRYVCDECRGSEKVKEVEEKINEGNNTLESKETSEEAIEEETEEEAEEEASKFTEQDALSW